MFVKCSLVYYSVTSSYISNYFLAFVNHFSSCFKRLPLLQSENVNFSSFSNISCGSKTADVMVTVGSGQFMCHPNLTLLSNAARKIQRINYLIASKHFRCAHFDFFERFFRIFPHSSNQSVIA